MRVKIVRVVAATLLVLAAAPVGAQAKSPEFVPVQPTIMYREQTDAIRSLSGLPPVREYTEVPMGCVVSAGLIGKDYPTLGFGGIPYADCILVIHNLDVDPPMVYVGPCSGCRGWFDLRLLQPYDPAQETPTVDTPPADPPADQEDDTT